MKRFFFYHLPLIFFFLFMYTTTSFAADSVAIPGYTFTPPSYLPKYADRYTILNNFLSLFLSITSLITLGYIIWGGLQFITSAGEKQAVQNARNRITYAIIGLILTFLSFFMVKLVGYLFATNTLNL